MANLENIFERISEVEYFINWYSSNLRVGMWSSETLGQGYEFETISEYGFRDNPKHINWRATARSGGQTILKNEFAVEKNISVFLVVDTSGSMQFGTQRETKAMLSAEIAAIFSYSALRFNDEVGLITWPESIYLPPSSTSGFYYTIVESLMERRAAENKPLSEALQYLPKKRCLIVLVSDFLGIDNLHQILIEHIDSHDFVALMITDSMEIELPPVFCFLNLRDLETGAFRRTVFSKDTLGKFRRAADKHRMEVMGIFDSLGIPALKLSSDYLPEDLAKLFLEKRLWL